MGNYASKLFSHHPEHEAKSKIQSQSSPCATEKPKLCTPPISKRKLAVDPRSATIGITRTPIEIISTPPSLTRRVASALPKYLQGRRYLETDFDAGPPVTTPEKCVPDPRSPNVAHQRTPIIVKSLPSYLTPVVVVNEGPDTRTPVASATAEWVLDPRSPATDFDRTPILKRSVERIATSSEEIEDGLAQSNACHARLSFCETTTDFYLPEIQAVAETDPTTGGESPSSESRADPRETSSEISVSSRSSSFEDICSAESEPEEQVTVIRNPQLSSPRSHALSTWTECKSAKGDQRLSEKEAKRDEPLAQTTDDDLSDLINAVIKNSIGEAKASSDNDKIKVWRDSLSPEIPEQADNAVPKGSEEIIIEFDDEVATKIPKNTPVRADDDRARSQTRKKKPQAQQQVKVEKRGASDERRIFYTDGKNSAEIGKQNRTPLGNRSNNHHAPLVAAKSPQQILRNKGHLSARTIHHENTPPHTERFLSKTKPSGIQWDADTTVII